MTKFISEPLDSCNKNLVNTKQSQTIGDYLCQQVRRWLRNDDDFKANGRDNIKLPVYYSQCGKVRMKITVYWQQLLSTLIILGLAARL